MPVRDRNDSLRTARNINSTSTTNGDIGFTFGSKVDRNDYYRFSIGGSSNVSVTLTGLRQNANLTFLNASGQAIGRSFRGGRSPESITFNNLAAGNYFVQVSSGGRTAKTNYRLSVNTSPIIVPPPVINTAPTITSNSIRALRGSLTPATTIIRNTTLNTTDAQQNSSQLTYTLTSLPGSGSLFRNGVQLAVGSTFTQADINNGVVGYQQQILRTIPNSAGIVGDPVISGSNIAWISGTGNSAEVYFYNGTTGTTTRLTNNSRPDSNVQISGSNIVWDTQFSSGERDIQFSVNGATPTTINSSTSFDDFNPKISGSRIAFQRNELSGDTNDGIYQYEISTGITFARLNRSNEGSSRTLTGISGGNVVWATSFGTGSNVERDVYFYNANTTSTTVINASTDFDDFNPLISDSHIAFQRDQRSGSTSDGIYLYTISTGTTSLVPSSNVSSGLTLRDISTSGSTVVWDTFISNVEAAYVYNGTQTSVLTATSGGRGFFPSISNPNIAFRQNAFNIGINLYFSNGVYQHISTDFARPFISGNNVVWRNVSSADNSSRLLLYSGAPTNDSFNFTVSDGLLTATGTLNIT